MAVQRLIRFVVVPGVDGQGQLPAPSGAKGAIHEIPACELSGKGVQRPGSDVALKVPHGVEGGFADGFAVVVSPLPVFGGGQHVPVPVQHGPGGQLALGVVKMAVEGGGGPAFPLGEIAEEEEDHPRPQRQSQQQADKGPVFNFLHKSYLLAEPSSSPVSFPASRPSSPRRGGGCSRGSLLPLEGGGGNETKWMSGVKPDGMKWSF